MTDKEIFEAVKQRFTDPKVMDLLRAGLADKNEMEDVKRAIRYGDAAMRNPILRDKLYKIFDRLLNVVKDDSTTRQMVKQDLRQLQKKQGDSAMSEDLNTANVEKAVMHDCVTHVVDEEWGIGQCLPGMHNLSSDGTVTHYDIMFEHGIERNVFIDEKKTKSERKVMHEHVIREAEEMAAVTPEGGEADAGKASRKDLKMPLEKLKAIMEKRKMKMKKMMEEDADEELIYENIEDRHADVYGEFEDHINKVPAKHKKALHTEFHRHAKLFDKAHERDDDEQMGHALDNMKEVVGKIKQHAGISEEVEQVQQINEAAHMVSRLSSETKKHLYNAHKTYAKNVEGDEEDDHFKHLDKAEHSHYKAKGSPGAHKGFDSLHPKQQRSLASALSTHHREPDDVTWMKYNVDNVSSSHMQDAHDHGLSEAKAPTVPKTEKEKRLAALAPPHDKITHADVLRGRGIIKEAPVYNVTHPVHGIIGTHSHAQGFVPSKPHLGFKPGRTIPNGSRMGSEVKDRNNHQFHQLDHSPSQYMRTPKTLKEFVEQLSKSMRLAEDTTHSIDIDDEDGDPKGSEALDKAHDHFKKKGYKISHESGDPSISKKVKNPDITYHYGYGDDMHHAFTVHKDGRAAQDPHIKHLTKHLTDVSEGS